MKTIGDRIKELRKNLQLSQAQVAKAVGVTQEAISKLERTRGHVPMSDNLQALAKLLDVDPDWLLTGKGSQKPVTPLSDEEAELLLLYRAISPIGQQYVLGRAKQLHAEEYGEPENTHKPKGPDRPQDPPSGRKGH